MRILIGAAAALAVLLASNACTSPVPPPPPPPPAIHCGPLLPYFVMSGEAGAQRTIYGQSFGNQLLFLSGLDIEADGAPRAYHPDDAPGLDALANAGRTGNWWALATKPNGTPFIQTMADPAPGFYVSRTALFDAGVGDIAAPRRYVDASAIPYFSLPGGSRAKRAFEEAGAKLGDFAMVFNLRTRKMAGAVWTDIGPSDRLGEGSIKLAELLGYENTSPRTGGTAIPENLFLIFPGTSMGFPTDPAKIDRGASDLLLIWGGRDRLEDCARQLGYR